MERSSPVNARTWLTLAILCICAVAGHSAWAQRASGVEEASSQSPMSLAPEAAPSYAGGSAGYRHYDRHQWIAYLLKTGALNRSLPNPYRVAMPLKSFGDAGPKIMLTYGNNMSGNTADKGLILFVTVEIP